MACGEVVETAMVPLTKEPGFESPSADEWRELYRGLIEEAGRGVCTVADSVVVVARNGSG